ncbi:hypothetical protein R50073_23770 [Maricurvus nonylphenolicus]|uniref:carboxymuconolactone decarboxylase family protein n=1 Tax=Maricurvus nonylphenolicus TaxID=1008307 RepID=UPI0036F3A249
MTEQLEARHVAPLPTSLWPEELQGVVRDMNGKPIHVHQLMANNPTLLNAWWNFRNHSVDGGTLGKRLGELVILRVSVHMQAWYEWGSHVDRGLRCGLTQQDILRVLDYNLDENWSNKDASLLRAVDELIVNHGLSPEVGQRISQHLSTAQIMDVIAIQGMYVILACMINTWGLALDNHVAKAIEGITDETSFKDAAAKFAKEKLVNLQVE